jgi:hypothetical protein
LRLSNQVLVALLTLLLLLSLPELLFARALIRDAALLLLLLGCRLPLVGARDGEQVRSAI